MKLHKFTIVAFLIWVANAIYAIKLKSFRPYFWAIVIFFIVIFLQSCSSGWSCKKRYVETPKEKIEKKITKPLA
jgi:hypothetical protein